MPTSRTVMLLIKAQNATGEALKAVQGDMNKVAETATKMGEKTEKGFMQGIKGAMAFVRQIKGIYFIIAGLVIGILVKLTQPVNEYVKTLNKMSETANLTGKDISRLAEIIEKQGRAMGMGTLALATATGDVEQASNSYASIMNSLKGMYEKMLPAMNSQDTILKRLRVDFNGLYRAMQGPIELIEVFGNKGLTARDAYILFGDKFAEVLKLLNMSPEALKKMQDEMDAATAKTLANKEKMKEAEQAVKDLQRTWDDFRAMVQPIVLKVVTEGLQNIVDSIEGLRNLTKPSREKLERIFPSGAGAFVGPPAPAAAVPGVLPPELATSLEQAKTELGVWSAVYDEATGEMSGFMKVVIDASGKWQQVTADSIIALASAVSKFKAQQDAIEAKINASIGNL